MRHRKSGGKLGRTSAHRKAMLRNLVTSLLEEERIQTTDAKAKELRKIADKMITLGKRGDLHARRQALSVIRSREVTAKVFEPSSSRDPNDSMVNTSISFPLRLAATASRHWAAIASAVTMICTSASSRILPTSPGFNFGLSGTTTAPILAIAKNPGTKLALLESIKPTRAPRPADSPSRLARWIKDGPWATQ